METEIPAMLRLREAVAGERFTFHSSRMRMKKVTREELVAMDRDSDRCALELSDARVDVLAYADVKDKTQVGVEIHSGRNRIVRRIFEALGYDVRNLDRVIFAGLTKKNVERGKWRFLTEKEVRDLKYFGKGK